MDLLISISTALQNGEDEEVVALIEGALEQNIPPVDILNKGMIAGMNVVGEKFSEHEIFLPDVLLAAKAMQAGMDRLKPLLAGEDIPRRGKIVLGTVRGDLHDIGKNLVGIMLRGAGFEVIDLGRDVFPEQFVETAEKESAEVIGMSALLTTTMQGMKHVIELLNARGLNGRTKTIVGGAPVSADFAREIGADAYAYDAAKAVACVKGLIHS